MSPNILHCLQKKLIPESDCVDQAKGLLETFIVLLHNDLSVNLNDRDVGNLWPIFTFLLFAISSSNGQFVSHKEERVIESLFAGINWSFGQSEITNVRRDVRC